MRKKSRCIAVLAVTTALLLTTACGTGAVPAASAGSGQETEDKLQGPETETAGEEAEEAETETKEAEEAESGKQGEIGYLKVRLEYQDLSVYSDDYSYGVNSGYSEVSVDGNYDQLQTELAKYNGEIRNAVHAQAEECFEWAKSDYADYKPEGDGSGDRSFLYSADSKATVRRADDVALSILRTEFVNSGGAHPTTAFSSANFDPQTGKQLALGDVITDPERLPEVLQEKLLKEYDRETFFEPDKIADTIREMMQKPDEYGEITFLLENGGVSFIFSQYTLAPYAAGPQTVTLTYKEDSAMLNPVYEKHPEYYIEQLADPEHGVIVTGGAEETVQVEPEWDSNDFITSYTIKVGDRSVEIKTDDYPLNVEVYAVHAGSGDFLYLQEGLMDDYSQLRVCSLNGELKEAGVYPWHFSSGDPAVNPDEMLLYERMDLLSTFSVYCPHHVGEDGIPVKDDAIGRFPPESGLELVSKAEIEGTILNPEDSDEGTKETLPAGTKFKFERADTDKKSFVDFRLEDGRLCRLTITSSEWPQEVNGTEASELFEELWYAG